MRDLALFNVLGSNNVVVELNNSENPTFAHEWGGNNNCCRHCNEVMDLICYLVFYLLCVFGSEIFCCCWFSWSIIFVFLDLIIFCFWLSPMFLDLSQINLWILCFCSSSLFFQWGEKLTMRKGGNYRFFQIRDGGSYFFPIWEIEGCLHMFLRFEKRCHHGGCTSFVIVCFLQCHHRGSYSGVISIGPWWLQR